MHIKYKILNFSEKKALKNCYEDKIKALKINAKFIMEQMMEVESTSQPWQGRILTTELHLHGREDRI